MSRPFLTARWANLLLASYAVPDEWLASHLPRALELDRRDGSAFVSLVAFDFLETRVRGLRIPGHVDFPEVNLRFYVRHPASGRRGVCFVREFVPRRAVALAARWLYNEPYARAALRSRVERSEGRVRVSHSIRRRGRSLMETRVIAHDAPLRPARDSVEHWFKEHEWGFGRDRRGRTLEYRVEHPEWDVFAIDSCLVRVDFGSLYGPMWKPLTGVTPCSTVLAVGSEVSVFPGARLVES
ncbi:MAG: DUF2071 domain-containing protein [Phycisphaeraceae bacterium]|nr:DUF2071 domain-containing protein [Phycisphaeraceae bacterium]